MPQLISPSLLVTVPEPVPERLTEIDEDWGIGAADDGGFELLPPPPQPGKTRAMITETSHNPKNNPFEGRSWRGFIVISSEHELSCVAEPTYMKFISLQDRGDHREAYRPLPDAKGNKQHNEEARQPQVRQK